jgi:hypothetical protein
VIRSVSDTRIMPALEAMGCDTQTETQTFLARTLHVEAYMDSKLLLCQTRLGEAESQLKELVMAEQSDSAVKVKLTTALGHVEKAIALLRSDAVRSAVGH